MPSAPPPFLRRVRLAEPEPVDVDEAGVDPEAATDDQSEPAFDPGDFPNWYQDRLTEDDEGAPGDAPTDEDHDEPGGSGDYVAALAAVRTIERIGFGPVTVLAGDNGTGKSTLVEAIAVAAGFNAEGGSRNLQFTTNDTHSALADDLVLEWERRPRWGWFLRAETFYGMATHIEADPFLVDTFPRLHDRSHGESFLDLAAARFTGAGLYLLDEPESALSIQGQIALAVLMADSLARGSQFIVSTHSPFLMAFPDAAVYELDLTDGVRSTTYDDLAAVALWRRFLDDPPTFYRNLVFDDD